MCKDPVTEGKTVITTEVKAFPSYLVAPAPVPVFAWIPASAVMTITTFSSGAGFPACGRLGCIKAGRKAYPTRLNA